MSISRAARLVVAVPCDELGLDQDDYDNMGLEVFQPYYDANMSNSLVGLRVFSSSEYELSNPLPEKYKLDEAISFAFAKFLTITDKVGNLYLTMDCH